MNSITLGLLNPSSASEFSMQPTIETKYGTIMQRDEPATWWKPCYTKPVKYHRFLQDITVNSMTHFMANLMRQWIPDFTYG